MQSDNYHLKREIRNRLLSLRNNLDKKWIEDKSIQIEEILFKEKDFLEITNILFYDAFEKEVQTKRMVRRALGINKKVFLTAADFKNKDILISEIGGRDKSHKIIMENEIEMVIVPGVAFNKSGARIGFGMGFYDRFLSGLSSKTKTIGLAFDFQIVDEIPVFTHDFLIDKIITEKRVINCHKKS